MGAQLYTSQFTLKNGQTITLRSIRPDDRDRLRAAFRNLEPATIYTRFFTAKKELTDAELLALTDVDLDATVALVATIGEKDNETIVAGGRFAVFPHSEPKAAEVAFTTEEDFQGLGLASLILRELAGIAREKGIRRFVAEVLPGNSAMLNVFRRSELVMKSRIEEGVTHVELSL